MQIPAASVQTLGCGVCLSSDSSPQPDSVPQDKEFRFPLKFLLSQMDEKAVEEGKTRQSDLSGMSLVTFPDLILCLPGGKKENIH